jgi:SAM-dependent methyltransferase
MKDQDIKKFVKEKYGKIASSASGGMDQGCSCSGCCAPDSYTVFSEDYNHLDGYDPDADLNLGCGIPVEYACIGVGDHILDLGSGAGNDSFVARAITGENGHVTGLDFTDEMLLKAEENRMKLGYGNVEFIKGDIEEMPLPDKSYDVVLSNCVLNLVTDKRKAFSEIMRVLRPGGHFCVSDIVIIGDMPEIMREDAELYAGCVAGASQYGEYTEIIQSTGFTDLAIHKTKKIELPDSNGGSLASQNDSCGIFSITISATKPASNT